MDTRFSWLLLHLLHLLLYLVPGPLTSRAFNPVVIDADIPKMIAYIKINNFYMCRYLYFLNHKNMDIARKIV